jgi:hypothetical protein
MGSFLQSGGQAPPAARRRRRGSDGSADRLAQCGGAGLARVGGLDEELRLLDAARRLGAADARRRTRVAIEQVLARAPARVLVEEALGLEEARAPFLHDIVGGLGDVDVLGAHQRARGG